MPSALCHMLFSPLGINSILTPAFARRSLTDPFRFHSRIASCRNGPPRPQSRVKRSHLYQLLGLLLTMYQLSGSEQWKFISSSSGGFTVSGRRRCPSWCPCPSGLQLPSSSFCLQLPMVSSYGVPTCLHVQISLIRTTVLG